MAEKNVPNNDENKEYITNLPAEMSEDDDIIEYIQVNSLDALKARFGTAEEDENIRNEGFGLARSGGLIRKPRPEMGNPFYISEAAPKDDIPTDDGSELSKVFDSAKSEHDNDNIDFVDLEVKSADTNKDEASSDEKKISEAKAEEKPVKKRSKSKEKVQKADEKAEEKVSEDEEIQIVRKFNTNTRVVYVDESLDDGIKRNTETELAELFDTENKERKGRLWLRRRK